MPIELRSAVPEDAAVIAALWHAGWADAHEGRVPSALLEHRSHDSFRDRVPVRLDTTTVAVVDGLIGGFVITHRDEIEQLYVDRRRRGTGVAGPLLHHGEQVIAASHARAWLAVVDGNVRARRFYERCGWHDRGPFKTQAWTNDGAATIAVPVRRYEKVVRQPGDAAAGAVLVGAVDGGGPV